MTSWKPSSLKSVLPTLSKFALSAILLMGAFPTWGATAKKTLKALPLVTFFRMDSGDTYNWWAENKSREDMWRISRSTYLKVLTTSDMKLSYLPLSSELLKKIPSHLRQTALTPTQLKEIAEISGADILIRGDYRFSDSPLVKQGRRVQVRLEAVRPSGAVIAELIRFYDVSRSDFQQMTIGVGHIAMEPFLEITENILTAKSTAEHGIHLLVSGKLNQKQVELLRQTLQTSIKGVKDVHISFLEAEQIGFRLRYAGSGEQLGRDLGQVEFPRFMTQVVSADPHQVLFDVKVRPQ